MTDQMKEAVKGGGGGLQSISSAVGDAIGDSSDMRGGESKKADEAGEQIGNMAQSGAQTVSGTSKGGAEQMQNMGSGSADHLGIGK